MLNRILLICTLAGLTACSNPTNTPLEDLLIQTLSTSSSQQDQYTACVLLGELNFDIAKLNAFQPKQQNRLSSLCKHYLSAVREPSDHNIQSFFTELSDPELQKKLWKTHEASDHPVSLLPPQYELVSRIAVKNDQALSILVKSIETTDGVFAESLSESIAQLYLQNPERVDLMFKQLHRFIYSLVINE